MMRNVVFLILICAFSVCQQANNQSFKIEKVTQFKGSSIRGLSVVNEQCIWLSGSKGLVALSVNQGKSWQRIQAPDDDSLDFRSIQAFNENEAMIASAGFPCRIYYTKDQGENWQLTYENLDSSAFINSLLFLQSDKGLAFGDVIDGRHLILQSDSNKQSWSRVDSTLMAKPVEGENGFAASNACIAQGLNKTVIALGGKKTRVLISKDEGESWRFALTPYQSNTAYGGVYAMKYANGQFIGIGGDFAQADSRAFAIISSDGEVWKLSNQPLNGYRCTVDYFPLSNTWLAAGTNGIDQSTDDGENWQHINETNLNTLRAIPSSSIGIAADSKGNVYQIVL